MVRWLMSWLRKPRIEDVAQDIRQRLEAVHPGVNYEFEERTSTLRGSDKSIVSVHNVFIEYGKAPRSERAAVLAKFVQGMSGPAYPDDFEEARPNLLPVIRAVSGLDLARISTGDVAAGPSPWTSAMRPVSQEVSIAVAYDTEHAIAQPGEEQLVKWGVTFDEALAIATYNLRHKAPPSFVEASPGLFMSLYGDFYDAARLTLPELFWQLPVSGEPVAMAPNRVCLLVAGSKDERALAEMMERAAKILDEESRPLSGEMFLLAGQAWQPWTPEGKVGQDLRNLLQRLRTADYHAQQQALQQAHERAGLDIFVATHTLVQRQETLLSYSVLPQGVDAWLPKTDLVMLIDAEGVPPHIVAWDAFEAEASDLLTLMPFTLPRYKAARYPDAEAIERMKAATPTELLPA